MNIIDIKVQKLLKKHNTNDPKKIAFEKGITILYEELGKNIWGYFTNNNRIPIIHINNKLDYFKTLYTIAHELGHHVLHPQTNTPFLRRNTLFSIDKIEREANQFALHLLIGDKKIEYDETLTNFLLRCNIPTDLHIFY